MDDGWDRFRALASAAFADAGAGPDRVHADDALRPAMAWAVPGAWVEVAAQPQLCGACGKELLALLRLRRQWQRLGPVSGGDEAAGLRRRAGVVRPAGDIGAALLVAQSAALSQPRAVRSSWKA